MRLEVNTDKTVRDHVSGKEVGRSQDIKIDISSFERVEQLKYLGTILRVKILFRKKLRADLSKGMLAIIR